MLIVLIQHHLGQDIITDHVSLILKSQIGHAYLINTITIYYTQEYMTSIINYLHDMLFQVEE